MKITLNDIKNVRIHWSESAIINEIGRGPDATDHDDIEKDLTAAEADALIARAATGVTGGYDKTPLTITLNDGTVWCRHLKYYIVRGTTGLLSLIDGDNE